MPGEHPAEDNGRALDPEHGPAQRHGGRNGGHPVEPIEDNEQHQRCIHVIAEQAGGGQQGHASQAVVGEQQDPRIDPVAQPARADRADDVEDADQRQQRRGRGGRHAVIVRGGHEVGLDQAVGRPAADEEGAEQHPEGRRRRTAAKHGNSGLGG